MSLDSINKKVFELLNGKWLVSRRFEGSYRGMFNGEARFVPEPTAMPSYLYNELGELTDGDDQKFDAKQSYRYRLAEGKIEVLKREESSWMVMHELDFKEDGDNVIASATHTHLCGQDNYAAEYRVDLSGNWEVTYEVKGPKKDYIIHSVYTKESCKGNLA